MLLKKSRLMKKDNAYLAPQPDSLLSLSPEISKNLNKNDELNHLFKPSL